MVGSEQKVIPVASTLLTQLFPLLSMLTVELTTMKQSLTLKLEDIVDIGGHHICHFKIESCLMKRALNGN